MKVIFQTINRCQQDTQTLPVVVNVGNAKLDLKLAVKLLAQFHEEMAAEMEEYEPPVDYLKELQDQDRVFMDKFQICIYGDEEDVLIFREDMLSEVQLED